MRRAALSNVWANQRELGCRYPAAVESKVGIKLGGGSGLMFEGELESQRAGDLGKLRLQHTLIEKLQQERQLLSEQDEALESKD